MAFAHCDLRYKNIFRFYFYQQWALRKIAAPQVRQHYRLDDFGCKNRTALAWPHVLGPGNQN